MAMPSTYPFFLVAISVAIAVIAAYTVLSLVRQVSSGQDRTNPLWVLGGALVLGSGIWSMHLLAMLAFRYSLPMAGDLLLSLLSLLIAAIAAGLMLMVIHRSLPPSSGPEAEDRFRQIAENIDGVFWMANPDRQQIIYVSPAYESIWGQTCESLYQNPASFLEAIHPEDRDRIAAALAKQVQGQYNEEYRIVHPNGSVRWIQDRAFPIRDRNSKVYRVVGIAQDTTERKQTELALQKVRQDITNILESLADGLCAIDREWRFTYLNSHAEQNLFQKEGLAPGGLVGKGLLEEFPAIVGSVFYQQYQRAFAEEKPVEFEEFYPPHNAWYQIRAYPYLSGLSICFKDISKRKRAEIALKERSRLSILSSEIGIAFGKGGSLQESLQYCLDTMVLYLGAAFGAIWTYNPLEEQLERQANLSPEIPTEIFPKQLPLDDSLIGSIGKHRQSHLTNTALEDDILVHHDWIQQEEIVGFVGYPLVLEDRLIGVLILASTKPFTDAALSTLGWTINNMAVAIDRVWVREELLSRRESLLFGLANQIRNSLDLDTILETTVKEIRSILKTDCCVFSWYRPQAEHPFWEVVKEAQDPSLTSLIGQYPNTTIGSLADRLLDRKPICVDEVERLDEPILQQFLQGLGCKSMLALPLQTYTGEIGVVSCLHYAMPRCWGSREVELLQAVTDQLAIAIDQADLYTQAQDAARQAQEQTRQLQQTLDQLRETQTQLIHTEKMSSLGQLIAGIAHEINNPINFINGNLLHASNYLQDILSLLQLYQKQYPNPTNAIEARSADVDLEFLMDDFPKMLSSMKIGADRIRQIVLSLRNFSRLDEAEMKPVNLHDGIDNTLLILNHRWKPNGRNPGVQIVKDYGKLPMVDCYAGELNQVFMNVISNAIDALQQPNPLCSFDEEEAAPPTITIHTEAIHKTDDIPSHVGLRITDNGPGISETVKSRLFDPFFTTKPVGQGTGLGLSIAYQIVVERHKGILQCHSEPGQGAEFYIEIPIRQLSR